MATQGTVPAVTSPPSTANPQGSSTHTGLYQAPACSQSLLFQQIHHEQGPAANNGVKEPNIRSEFVVKQDFGSNLKEEEPNIGRELVLHKSMIGVENEETIEKYKKYEADYACHLLAKYFSDKNIHEDDIFEDVFAMDGKSIKASRSPCTRSYTDRLQSDTEPRESTITPDAAMAGNIPNGRANE